MAEMYTRGALFTCAEGKVVTNIIATNVYVPLCVKRSKLNKFRHMGGAGARVMCGNHHNRQTDRQTQIKTLPFRNFVDGW